MYIFITSSQALDSLSLSLWQFHQLCQFALPGRYQELSNVENNDFLELQHVFLWSTIAIVYRDKEFMNTTAICLWSDKLGKPCTVRL